MINMRQRLAFGTWSVRKNLLTKFYCNSSWEKNLKLANCSTFSHFAHGETNHCLTAYFAWKLLLLLQTKWWEFKSFSSFCSSRLDYHLNFFANSCLNLTYVKSELCLFLQKGTTCQKCKARNLHLLSSFSCWFFLILLSSLSLLSERGATAREIVFSLQPRRYFGIFYQHLRINNGAESGNILS